jgi:hypothetical protein
LIVYLTPKELGAIANLYPSFFESSLKRSVEIISALCQSFQLATNLFRKKQASILKESLKESFKEASFLPKHFCTEVSQKLLKD